MFQPPEDSFQINFYSNRQHPRNERCFLNVKWSQGQRGRDGTGVGRMDAEFGGRLQTGGDRQQEALWVWAAPYSQLCPSYPHPEVYVLLVTKG